MLADCTHFVIGFAFCYAYKLIIECIVITLLYLWCLTIIKGQHLFVICRVWCHQFRCRFECSLLRVVCSVAWGEKGSGRTSCEQRRLLHGTMCHMFFTQKLLIGIIWHKMYFISTFIFILKHWGKPLALYKHVCPCITTSLFSTDKLDYRAAKKKS